MKTICILALLFAASGEAASNPGTLNSNDRAAGDQFGFSVWTWGNTSLIGAPGKDGMGSAYVFLRDPVNGWGQPARLDALDRAALDQFGYSVAISSGIALVGAPGKDHEAGAIYVFTSSGGTWTQQAKLTAPNRNSGDRFGASVAFDSDTAIIGAPGALKSAGAAYVFARGGTSWTLSATLTSSDTSPAQFGAAAAVAGGTAVIGAPGQHNRAGAAHFFVNSSGAWIEQTSVSSGSPGDLLGASVAVDGDRALIGAPGTQGIGIAEAFVRSGTQWIPDGSLTASVSHGALFGNSVAIKENTALVGAPDSNTVWLFLRSQAGWGVAQSLPAPAAISSRGGYGNSVSLYFLQAVVGSVGADCAISVTSPCPASDEIGSAYAFGPVTNVAVGTNAPVVFTTGPGCSPNGVFSLVVLSEWTKNTCSVQFDSPQNGPTGTRYVFDNWDDSNASNPRDLSSFRAARNTAQFHTEYLLTTTASPASFGAVSGAGWYTQGTSATVTAAPGAGRLFSGFSGDLTGIVAPQSIPMNGPHSVTAHFVLPPPPILSALIAAKSGGAGNRVWTISVSNSGQGAAFAVQIDAIELTQTFGAACPPARLTPVVFPIPLGDLAPAVTGKAPVQYDFGACPANVRFTATIVFSSTSGLYGGASVLVNQLQ